MNRLRAIILDFDGVLVDSNGVKDAAFRSVFAQFPKHADAAFAYHRDHVEATRYHKFHHLVNHLLGHQGDVALVDALVAQFGQLATQGVRDAPEVAGATSFVARFGTKVPLFVASVTPQAELEDHLAGRGWSERIVGAYGDPPTPKRDAIGLILRRVPCRPDEAVVVGDSPSDLKAAEHWGVPFLGRNAGAAFPKTVRLHRDMDEVGATLQARLGENQTLADR